MPEYKVAVTETYRKYVYVNAKDKNEAHQRAVDAWSNAEFVLNEKDFDGAEFYVVGESSGKVREQSIIIDQKEE